MTNVDPYAEPRVTLDAPSNATQAAIERLDGMLADLEEFGECRNPSHNKRAYVRRQARRARDELTKLARAVGLRVE